MESILSGSWWNSLTVPEQIFWATAIVFSILFAIQFVLSLFGVDSHHGDGIDTHGDSHDGTAGHHFGIDTDFQLLTVRSVIAFFTFFGWTGVLALRAGAGTWAAVGFGSLVGLAAMFIVGYMLYLFARMGEEGTINMKDAIYKTGEVYLQIPAHHNGVGKVFLQIGGAVRELDAITDGDMLANGSKVKVVEVLENNVLLVEASPS